MIGLRKPATATALELLDVQHKALLVGDFDRLSKMEDALQTVLSRLEKDGGDRAVLVQIKEAAARNARLLTAAQAGVSAAQGHLSTARSPGLTTYNAEGQTHASKAVHSRDLARR